MQWEYKRIQIMESDLDNILEEQGANGWEAVDLGEENKYVGRTVRFKRQKNLQNEVLNG